MPIANINWNGQTYRINFDRKLTDTEVFDYMQKNFPITSESIVSLLMIPYLLTGSYSSVGSKETKSSDLTL